MSYLKVIYTPESPASLLKLHTSRRKPRRNAVLLSNFIDIVMTFLSLHPADLNQLWCTTARPAASTRSTGERLVGTLFVVLLKGNRNLSPQADIYRGGGFFFSLPAGIPQYCCPPGSSSQINTPVLWHNVPVMLLSCVVCGRGIWWRACATCWRETASTLWGCWWETLYIYLYYIFTAVRLLHSCSCSYKVISL